MMYLGVGRKGIHAEGLILFIYKGNCLIHIIYSQYWKNWTKNLLLHDGV